MKSSFKKLGFIILALLLSSGIMYSQTDSQQSNKNNEPKAYSQKETKTVSKTIKPYSGKSFSLKNSFGEVIITGTDKNEVSIVAKISSKSYDAKKIVNDIDIRIGESSSSIDVETIIPKYLTKDRKDDNTKYNIDYTISLPKKTSLKIDNSFCKTDIKDISSKVDIKNTFGKLVLKNIEGV